MYFNNKYRSIAMIAFLLSLFSCSYSESDSTLIEELYSCTLVQFNSEVNCTEYMLNKPSATNFSQGVCNESNNLVFRAGPCSNALKEISRCDIPATQTESSKTTFGYDEAFCSSVGGSFSAQKSASPINSPFSAQKSASPINNPFYPLFPKPTEKTAFQCYSPSQKDGAGFEIKLIDHSEYPGANEEATHFISFYYFDTSGDGVSYNFFSLGIKLQDQDGTISVIFVETDWVVKAADDNFSDLTLENGKTIITINPDLSAKLEVPYEGKSNELICKKFN